ncbi:MAG: HAD-IIIA family hydrolase [Bacteroidia bacterium]|jgi:histidinol-phosphate phosphatase family protein|nr:HAD-IIIA family hydrolase [Bacteroidia bacterium]GIV23328.1 MAG: D-glycero-alpha-D-manno-heptose-1,7-bisphosphate 7-phosphatase [Bacteroidia bacterium]
MPAFDRSWTLFLDRDGVINEEKVGSYVVDWSEFRFLDGVPEALAFLSRVFGRIIVVTNQRGVGKGLMTPEALNDIHARMRVAIEAAGGRIDAVYACTEVAPDSPCRKPQVGMALWAQRDFPEIDFRRAVMVGNSDSDMLFGHTLGMHTVWIASVAPAPQEAFAHEIWPSLWAWAQSLRQGQS